ATRDMMLDKAVDMALRAVELAPEDSNIRDTLAEALFRSGNTQEAIKQAETALELDPGSAYFQEQLERFRSQ
ncbi:MAG: tetratricopeptide repeat protein, partial [Candidatus Fermentibacteraceae bacterium]|nr:tetratricopeptide repeat protein [Candidatus Fermentibacteraceae bacterium]